MPATIAQQDKINLDRSSAEMTIGIADPEDDAAIRSLLRSTVMPGRISVSFCREPSFFEAAAVEGNDMQVVVARHPQDGIVGMGCYSVKDIFINGAPQRIAYLSGLRGDTKHRSFRLLSKVFGLLGNVHHTSGASFCVTSIVSDNTRARKILESGVGRLPCYQQYGNYLTLVLRRLPAMSLPAGYHLHRATSSDLPALIAFLQEKGTGRQFFPRYQLTDFTYGLLRGLQPEDILLATANGQIKGCLGLWNQKSFKQSIVQDYSPFLKTVRPLYNLYAHTTRRTRLPKPGDSFSYLNVAIPVAENETILFALLTQAQRSPVASGQTLLTGLFDTDPLALPLKKFTSHCYQSTIYVVHWPWQSDPLQNLDTRTPYLELGAL